MSEARDQSLPPPPSDVPQPADGEAPPAEAPPPVQATDPAHDGPSSKQQLLDLEGMEIDADKVYIPSYFRRKQTALDHADFSAITLASLQAKLKDLVAHSGHHGPTFLEVINQKLHTLEELAQELSQDFSKISIRFRAGEIPQALDDLIDKKTMELVKRGHAKEEYEHGNAGNVISRSRDVS